MAGENIDLIIKAILDDASFQAGVANMGKGLKQTETQNKSFFESIKGGWVAASLAVAGAVGAIRELIKASSDNEQANQKLKSTMQATNQFTKEAFEQFQKFSEAMENTEGVTSETTKNLISMALNMGITKDKAAGLVQAAIGLSKALPGVDQERALKAVIAAQQGHYELLQRTLPELRNSTSAQDAFNKIMEISKNGLKEGTQMLSTYQGEITELGLKTKTLKQFFGDLLEKAFTPVLKIIINLIDGFNNLSPAVKTVVAIAGMLLTAMLVLPPAITAVSGALALLEINPIVLGVAAFAAGLTGLIATLSALEKTAHGIERLTRELDTQNKAIENNTKYLKQLEEMRASGTKGLDDTIAKTKEQIDLNKKEAKSIEEKILALQKENEKKAGLHGVGTPKYEGTDNGKIRKQEEADKAFTDYTKKQFETRRDVEMKSYSRELSDAVKFGEDRIAIEKQHIANMAKIKEDEQKATLGNAQKAFADMATLTKGEKSKGFTVNKAAAIGEATISTYLAAAKAMGEVPFPLNIVEAALVTAMGLKNVADISGVSMSFAEGSRSVPYDMIAKIHEGEAIIPKAQNPFTKMPNMTMPMMGGGSGGIINNNSRNSTSSQTTNVNVTGMTLNDLLKMNQRMGVQSFPR